MSEHERGKGVFLDRASLGADVDLAGVQATLDEWEFHPTSTPEEVAERVRDATVAVTNKIGLDAAALDRARNLRLVCVSATGTDHIDLVAAARNGITVCNVRGYATPSVVQHVFALALALC